MALGTGIQAGHINIKLFILEIIGVTVVTQHDYDHTGESYHTGER
jgi:hypothetical protein